MPYKLRKAPRRELYWVITKATGKKHSIEPLPLKRAEAQMRSLYARESGYPPIRSGGAENVVEEETKPVVVEASKSAPSFPQVVTEPEPYVSQTDVEDLKYSGGSYYPEQYNTYPITIRKPTGYKSPAILKMTQKRAVDLSRLDEATRRSLGFSSRGDIV